MSERRCEVSVSAGSANASASARLLLARSGSSCSRGVLGTGDDFDVFGVHAGTDAAEMVAHHPRRDGSHVVLVDEAMGAAPAELPVPGRVAAAHPQMAGAEVGTTLGDRAVPVDAALDPLANGQPTRALQGGLQFSVASQPSEVHPAVPGRARRSGPLTRLGASRRSAAIRFDAVRSALVSSGTCLRAEARAAARDWRERCATALTGAGVVDGSHAGNRIALTFVTQQQEG